MATLWSHPLTIILVLFLILFLLLALAWALLRPGSTDQLVITVTPSASASPTRLGLPSGPDSTGPPAGASTLPIATDGAAAPGGGLLPGTGLPAAPEGPGVTFHTGTFDGRGGADLDLGRYYDDDIEANTYGINTHGGAVISRFKGAGNPELPDCTGIALTDWVGFVPAADLTPGAIYCYVTTNDRYGYFTVQGSRLTNAEQLQSLDCAFLTWRGFNDTR